MRRFVVFVPIIFLTLLAATELWPEAIKLANDLLK
jgi:hypothetical protein